MTDAVKATQALLSCCIVQNSSQAQRKEATHSQASLSDHTTSPSTTLFHSNQRETPPNPPAQTYLSQSLHLLTCVTPLHPLIPHILQMLQHRHIRIHEPIHTILRAALLILLQLPRRNLARHAFRPADISQAVHSYIITLARAQLPTDALEGECMDCWWEDKGGISLGRIRGGTTGPLGGRRRIHTMLDARFLGLVHEELLQFLLVGRGELGEVDLALPEAGGVHDDGGVNDRTNQNEYRVEKCPEQKMVVEEAKSLDSMGVEGI